MGVIKLFFIFIILLPLTGFAQPYETNPDFNRTRNWHFGYGVGLRFDPDTIYEVQTNIQTQEAASVHSDQDGNLLLYSNGEKIWNLNHEVIHNGNLLLGHRNSSQGALFIFHESNPNYIYLFYTNYNLSSTKELSYALIVQESDSFRVIFKDSVLQKNMCGAIVATKSANNNDIWLSGHAWGKNQLISYRLTKQGLANCPVISETKSTPVGAHGAFLSTSFSNDGKYFVKTNTNQAPPVVVNGIELYGFNSNTGQFKFLFSIDDTLSPRYRGICFSRNSNYLLASDRDNGITIYKFNPHDSLTTVSNFKKINLQGLSYSLQNLPYNDDVALMRLDSFPYTDLIYNFKDIDSIQVIEKKINLNYVQYAGVVFSNFVKSYFHTPAVSFTYQLNCVNNSVLFNGQDTFNANSHNWEIKKQGSNTITADVKDPLIEFTDTGVYIVRYIASNGLRSDTIEKNVTILPEIEKHFLGSDTTVCSGIRLKSPENMHCYEWSTGETTTEINVNNSGYYIAKIITPNYCVLYDTISVSVDTIETIENNFLGEDVHWCENLDTFVTIKAPDGFDEYSWSNGSFEKEIIVSQSGVYIVQIAKNNACQTIFLDTIVVSFDTVPSSPIIYKDNDTLKTDAVANNYQWLKDGNTIGENSPVLVLTDTGIYQLKISNSFNCFAFSEAIHVVKENDTFDNVVQLPNNPNIKLYPNPFTSNFQVVITDFTNALLIVSDITGRKINEFNLTQKFNTIETSGWSEGVYVVSITLANGQTIIYKIIKIHE